MLRLPTTATAPFCPSEVQGTVRVPAGVPAWKQMLRFLGPGLLISVGYMDPGNWATDISAGSHFGYALMSVVVLSSLAAILLQVLSLRLGLVAERDLAQLCRDQYRPWASRSLWAMAEIAIVACDVAEVLGSALAFKLLLHVPLAWGVLLTGLDTLFVLGLKGQGFRQLEAIVLGLIATIALCFGVELAFASPDWMAAARGLVPTSAIFTNHEMLYVAIGILGATVMPHNLYLHSSIVQTRKPDGGRKGLPMALRMATADTVVSLLLALLVNGAILMLAAAAFHRVGGMRVDSIEDAYRLLAPLTGVGIAGVLFGVALFASGQSSTFTGTIAGQVILEGFLDLKIPCWQRRAITRVLAIVPALVGVLMLGEHAVGRMLVFTQVVLSAQLPFAIYPLVRFTSSLKLMGVYVNPRWLSLSAWGLFGVITAANLWLVAQGFAG
ncbi:Nramp family divalent metal transporter [Caulobacter sp. S45]|uniref:Nramp family divalent metal transporter n=1 Tax=Caulobacter sp. S45 TaxID=1641861 RepID=UPI00131D964B|nr:Nramp family divalent metal transporter [Caulobacter sp. S45]